MPRQSQANNIAELEKELLLLNLKDGGEIAIDFVAKNATNLDAGQMKKILNMVGDQLKIGSDKIRIDVSKKWFEENNSDFKKFEELFLTIDDFYRTELFKSWVDLGSIITFEQLGILTKSDSSIRTSMVVHFINQDELEKYDLVLRVINTELLGSKYSHDKIITICKNVDLSAQELTNLTTNLYPNNQTLQVELLEGFISKGLFDKFKIDEKISVIKGFLNQVSDSDNALRVIDSLAQKGLSTDLILEMCSGRISNLYSSISGLLSASLENSLQESAVERLKSDLEIDVKKLNKIKLTDLFSYLDIKGKLEYFVQFIKPEILEELKSKFIIPERNSYISKTDYENLKILLGDKKPTLPSMQILCDYLKDKIPSVKTYDDEELVNYKINFSTKPDLDEETKKSLDSELAQLFKSKSPSPDDISNFLIKLVGADVKDLNLITDANRILVKDMFQEQKNNFANLLHNPEGINYVAALFFDPETYKGCVANIGTKFQGLLTGAQIKDPIDSTIYTFFSKIEASAFNELGKDHLTGNAKGADSFNNPAITTTFLSPVALVAEITKELNDNDPDQKLLWKIIEIGIQEICTPDPKMMTEIKSTLLGTDFEPELVKKKDIELIDLAVCLVINRVLGDNVPQGLFDQKLTNLIPSTHASIKAEKAESLDQSKKAENTRG
ncbi:MAG: hypothetical protein ACI9TO_000218 [Rickettsiales bacterium]|jgi:hypothetical protein